MATIAFEIEGMTCNHCVMRVQKALAGVAGVQKAVVTLQPGRARVEFEDGAATAAAMQDAVAKAGYTARVAA